MQASNWFARDFPFVGTKLSLKRRFTPTEPCSCRQKSATVVKIRLGGPLVRKAQLAERFAFVLPSTCGDGHVPSLGLPQTRGPVKAEIHA